MACGNPSQGAAPVGESNYGNNTGGIAPLTIFDPVGQSMLKPSGLMVPQVSMPGNASSTVAAAPSAGQLAQPPLTTRTLVVTSGLGVTAKAGGAVSQVSNTTQSASAALDSFAVSLEGRPIILAAIPLRNSK